MSSICPTLLPLASLAFLALGSASALQADIVFSNMTAGDCNCGNLLAGSGTFAESVAEAFTPAANYSLTGAAAPLDSQFGASGGTVDFAVYSNSGGLPGTSLATLGSATLSANQEGVFSVASPSSSVDLLAGTQYWLVLTPGTSGTELEWDGIGSTAVPFAYTHDATGLSGWTAPGPSDLQFQIDGTPLASPVPEPASVWLLLTAFGIAGLVYRKRHYGESRSTIHPSPLVR